jgi:CheY-like chemotaxis protein
MGLPTDVLVIEDGDEYLETLSRFVPGPRYAQVHSGEEALSYLEQHSVDLIYLDMRFDRIPRGELLGDHAQAAAQHSGDTERGWRYLQNNQGLFILRALRAAGWTSLPVIISYDFSHELRRWERLSHQDPRLRWVGDAAGPAEIERLMSGL